MSGCGQQAAGAGTARLEAKVLLHLERGVCSHAWCFSAALSLSRNNLQAGKEVDENTGDGKGQPSRKEIPFHFQQQKNMFVCSEANTETCSPFPNVALKFPTAYELINPTDGKACSAMAPASFLSLIY